MKIQQLKQYCKERIAQHPDLCFEIKSLLDLAISEIEEGGSEEHEIQLCISDIEAIIKETH
jgi:hypothetical protein